MFRLADPWFLLLLGLIPFSLLASRRQITALAYSSTRLLDLAPVSSWRIRLRWLPPILRALWMALVVIALCRPMSWVRRPATEPNAAAIEIVVDVSGSMGAKESSGQSRLDLVKATIGRLLSRGPGGIKARQVGVITFAQRPKVLAPLSEDFAAVALLVESLEVDRAENRTNIGDAVVLAAQRLRKSNAAERKIMLWTDGAHNVDDAVNPGIAARLAESIGVTIDAIAVGSAAEGIQDRAALEKIAAITGGRAFNVDRFEEWEQLPAELVRSSTDSNRMEWSVRDRTVHFLFAALIIWLVEAVLAAFVLRIVPTG